MIEQLPTWLNFLFLACVVYTISVFYFTNGKNLQLTIGIIIWSVAHTLLAYKGFYKDTASTPPRFALVLLPAIALIIWQVRSQRQKSSDRNLKYTVLIHLVRVPVEITLYYLFLFGSVPELMTFHGYNFDIIAGLTVPIAIFLYKADELKGLLLWNCLCLILIVTILTLGILSGELPIQLLAFDQPNIAVQYAPYVLLPATVVPLVIYSHMVDILELRRRLCIHN